MRGRLVPPVVRIGDRQVRVPLSHTRSERFDELVRLSGNAIKAVGVDLDVFVIHEIVLAIGLFLQEIEPGRVLLHAKLLLGRSGRGEGRPSDERGKGDLNQAFHT